MGDDERLTRIHQAQQIIEDQVRQRPHRIDAFTWKKMGPEEQTLILFINTRMYSIPFSEEELLEGFGSAEWKARLINKYQSYIRPVFGVEQQGDFFQ
jgi:hypothetical protein